jgi:hypothetical protein
MSARRRCCCSQRRAWRSAVPPGRPGHADPDRRLHRGLHLHRGDTDLAQSSSPKRMSRGLVAARDWLGAHGCSRHRCPRHPDRSRGRRRGDQPVTGARRPPPPRLAVWKPGRPLARGAMPRSPHSSSSISWRDRRGTPTAHRRGQLEGAPRQGNWSAESGFSSCSDTAFANIDQLGATSDRSATKTGISRSVFSW